MKVDPYLHAVLLLHGAGKEITEESLAKVLEASGMEVDKARVKVIAEIVKGVNWDEVLQQATVAVAQPAATQQAAEEKKEEKKEEEKKAEAAEGLAALFG